MLNVSKMSVKVEVTPEQFDDEFEMVQSAFEEALDILGCGYDEAVDKFFTMRFDVTNEGGIAATVSAAGKREN